MSTDLLLIFFVIFVFLVLCALIFQHIFKDIFLIYRENFLTRVDRGLREILLYMDPEQLFSLTLMSTIVIGITSFFLLNIYFAILFVALGLSAPSFVLPWLKRRRSDQFEKQLPNALESMAGSLQSGQNLVNSMAQVIKNQPNPIAAEFTQALGEYRIGRDLIDSFDDMCIRIDKENLVLFVSSIKISREVGGNLSTTLKALAHSLREKEKMEGKIRALTSMGVMQGWFATAVPLFVGYFFYLAEPKSMTMLFTTRLGWYFLGLIIFLMVMGRLAIKKVVEINV